jgi:endonuclease YncB( thermonuclease family)
MRASRFSGAWYTAALPDRIMPRTAAFPRALRLPALLLAAGAAWSAARAAEQVQIVEVYDGDTVRVERADGSLVSVRLIGVDAPEIDSKYREAELGGPAAAAFARRLIPLGPARLETDPAGDDADKYGRLLRYVRLADGRDAGAEIIAAGFAQTYRRFTYGRRDSYRALESQAKAAGRGLWGEMAGR